MFVHFHKTCSGELHDKINRFLLLLFKINLKVFGFLKAIFILKMEENLNDCFSIDRSEAEKNLRLARQEQIANRDHFLAVQAARDRAEFERVLKYDFLLRYQTSF